VNEKLKNLLLWLFVLMILASIFSNFSPRHVQQKPWSYSSFVNKVMQGEVSKVEFRNRVLSGVTQGGEAFTTYMPMEDPLLLSELLQKNVDVIGKPPEQRSFLVQWLLNWFPLLFFIGFWVYFMRQQTGGGGKGGPMSFGRSRHRLLQSDEITTTFDDVAGAEEAKEEVQELVDFLRDPGKYQRVGGKIPCGVLLVGSPGTGKTLLAKAVAGESRVPFFTISGSDFVEMFVGVGASRVRDMFAEAKKRAPCIIFIDEIDAVGRQRFSGVGGGNDEREQTLNQLLVEMDGFEGKEGVIVMAATNRPDVLDKALLRPGRFDRQVAIGLPDIKGRAQILKVHLKKVVLGKDVKPSVIARGTPGLSGADLANLVNEAALFAARENRRSVTMSDMERAKDKIFMGSERRSMVMSEDEKKLTAYHEGGHALVGLLVPDHDPVYKVSIIPRGRALGVTMYLPEQDRYSYSLQRLESQIASLYGGRLAEELIFGFDKVTTGASNDIERATELAHNIVTKWGLTSRLGPVAYESDSEELFMGRGGMGKQKVYSEETTKAIDKEVRVILDRNYKRAKTILEKHTAQLHAIADALIKHETIEETMLLTIVHGEAKTEAILAKRKKAAALDKDLDEPEKKTRARPKKTAAKKKNDSVD
jgi:cell division protease FtsH